MARLRDAIIDYNLLEVPYSGLKFSWMKGLGEDVVYERLDRGLANVEWFNLFPNTTEVHLDKLTNCGTALSKWNREVVGNIQLHIKVEESEMDNLLQNSNPILQDEDIKRCRLELSDLLLNVETLWR
ncbi:hypothetical protein PTKIN_Ptkin02bG0131900 [Pterospermum kingtungense]